MFTHASDLPAGWRPVTQLSEALGVLLLFLLPVDLFLVAVDLEAQGCGERTSYRQATETQVRFVNIAAQDSAGVSYRRGPSERNEIFDALKEEPTYTFLDLVNTPIKARGAPGVAIFDYDVDGDLDVFVTNGPGRFNSLYSNQLVETGDLEFVDVAGTARVGLPEMDAGGTCFGDIDNDGFQDLVILDSVGENRLLRNVGNGTFDDISAHSGIALPARASSSCSFGDIDADGYLDLLIGNVFIMASQRAIFQEPFALNQHNRLLRNLGDGTFEDVSAASGIEKPWLPVAAPDDSATITWALALVDIDLDGDVDVVQADDQGGILGNLQGGVDRGMIQILDNDGSGTFTASTLERGLRRTGFWMGLSFGDYDHSGTLDLFGSNFGDNDDSRWFFQNVDGTFEDIIFTVGLVRTPFGWGTSSVDYDNDGDTDILFHGGMDAGLHVLTNPGGVLRNDGKGGFSRDTEALFGSTEHVRRTVHGMAAGDLDRNGFIDIVSVSNFDMFPFGDYPLTLQSATGGEWDDDNFILETFVQVQQSPPAYAWQGFGLEDGTLSVETNSGNDLGWLQVQVLGGMGRTVSGRVNRDGIGAVVRVAPKVGETLAHPVLLPVLGGASHASQDSLIVQAGLGVRSRADVEVLWPGGVRNKLYDAAGCQVLRFPEIPCSFDTSDSRGAYQSCVQDALAAWQSLGELEAPAVPLFLESALRAYDEAR